MAQSKTVAATFFIIAFAAAAASVASAASASDAAATAHNLLLPGSRKLLGDAGKGMIQITTNDLLPASAAKSLTSGRAAGVSIQRQLLGDEWFPMGDHDSVKSGIGGVMHRQLISIPDLLPAAATEAVAKGMAEVVGFTKKLTGSVANAPAPAA